MVGAQTEIAVPFFSISVAFRTAAGSFTIRSIRKEVSAIKAASFDSIRRESSSGSSGALPARGAGAPGLPEMSRGPPAPRPIFGLSSDL